MAKAGPTPGAAPGAAAGTAAPAAASAPVAPAPGAAAPGGLKAWLPALATVLLAPACTWAVCQFVLIPQLQKQVAAAPATDEVAAHAAAGGGAEGKDGAPNFEFQNMVVNLSGTMGTRYLKTSFLVTGAEPGMKAEFESNKARLTDVTLNVLSSLSLADLEEPGAKNVLREKLVSAYNQALGRKVAEQVYFSDFVVQ
jgi:flagellar FliL protein